MKEVTGVKKYNSTSLVIVKTITRELQKELANRSDVTERSNLT